MLIAERCRKLSRKRRVEHLRGTVMEEEIHQLLDFSQRVTRLFEQLFGKRQRLFHQLARFHDAVGESVFNCLLRGDAIARKNQFLRT
jgi:hypothetical protein